ncbi:MAG: Globin-coupled histidine kinase [Phycisphaerae bacterium]|nr:Globin-coupled histidine kinase [Phycisphaerae bacterium]
MECNLHGTGVEVTHLGLERAENPVSSYAFRPEDWTIEHHGSTGYNGRMSVAIFDEMKTYVGFTAADAANLTALGPLVIPHVHNVLDRFYGTIMRFPAARRVLVGGEAQMRRLREHLSNWLRQLFCGTYDAEYAGRRWAIGHAHVLVGLPQHYMFTAMELVWQEFNTIVAAVKPPDAEARLKSLHKLLLIELGFMLESYKASYGDRVRQLEHDAMQDRVRRAEQLAEIGQLAASLAHEIKNPLAGISGAIQVIRDDLDPSDQHRVVLEEVLRHIDRLDGTVKDLLTYARPQRPRFKPGDLGAIVSRVATLLKKEPAFERVSLEWSPIVEAGQIELDEHQIEQLLVNLLLNAAHASRPGDVVQLLLAPESAWLSITVRDQGVGMDEETCRRAFEPFFTTKSRGTGLGLPICQRIVEAHGGSITLRSRVGGGTSVTVRMPRRQVSVEGGANG